MSAATGTWERVSKRNPCAICGRGDWCTVTDGACCCMRVESDRPLKNGGWLHKTENRPSIRQFKPRLPEPPSIDPTILLADWGKRTTPAQIVQHAEQLGVDPLALKELGAVWSGQAWAFPMRDGAGKVVGIRLRSTAGDKWAVKGSKAGLFLPQTLPVASLIYVVEGPTDTAAALTIGLYAIGRPSCLGCESDVIQTVRRLGCRQVVVVADADDPGQRGAEKLQAALPVASLIYTPPAKDIRAAVVAGMTADDVTRAIFQRRWTNSPAR